MAALPQSLHQFAGKPWNSLAEIALIGFIFYYTYRYFRGTRGARILAGLTLFFSALALLTQLFDLVVLHWLLDRFAVSSIVGLAVIFQPELRRIFAHLGTRVLYSSRQQDERTLDNLCGSVFEMASHHCGALIAIERGIGLRSYAETGVAVDAVFSSELLQTIFHPKTALHDGGVILRNERIVAAACIFPVTQRESLDRSFGLRHRAGLGLCEETDAIALIVSEETGSVSLCFDHSIERGLARLELRQRLGKILRGGVGRTTVPLPPHSPLSDEDQEHEND